ncbi:L,D-transpeptidase [Actinocorallia longicatena]|uniref:Ig-like domain-containing protein n=1 Tax=Actinocorallia longicatena TaxID=111803 RepID=A0ABP6QB90_9ACTN
MGRHTGEVTVQVNRAGKRKIAVGMTAAPVLAAAFLTGCSSEVTDPPDAAVLISPKNASGSVKPDTPITVKASKGRLQNVTVVSKNGVVEGVLAADGASWQSRWPLDPATSYSVTATAFGTDGQTETAAASFKTIKPKKTTPTTVLFPKPGETVGVGMPIKLHFDKAVTNRAGVERALEVRSTKPVEGAWHWFDSQNVVFRTKDYWPSHTKVRVVGHTTGVRFSKNVYGDKNVDLNFRIGDRIVTKGSARTHHITVKREGQKARRFPVSMGMGGSRKYTTTSGNHLSMEKEYMTIMTSPGIGPGSPGYYSQNVYWTVRISDSGEYLHSAPWSTGSQGNSNVSHGCVNMSPSAARWFNKISHRGDPINITGTSRQLETENGWGYWQLDWKQWVKGSKAKSVTTSSLTGELPKPAAPTTSTTAVKQPVKPMTRETVKS